jgi:PKD repeat protein
MSGSIGYRVFLATLCALLLAALGCAGTSSVSGGDGEGLAGSTPGMPGGAADAPAARVDEPGALSSLAVPEGVEPELWNMLTTELSRVLAERDASGKLASAPPMGEASATVLSYNASASTLSWRYYSNGDYNQDGLVSISDLTPLGQHYGESSPLSGDQPFPPDSLGAVIDGNGDGIINISDITQIGQNYGVRVDGYRIYAAEVTHPYPVEPAEPNREGAMLLTTVDMDAGSTIPGERRRFYSQVVPTEEKQYYWVRPYHGYADGVASNLVEVLVPPNQPPEAVLLYYGAARTPAHIRWDALASRDDDGAVVRYEWDFDGDGDFEYDSEGATQVDFYYYEAGKYTCALRVTDDEGATDTDATFVNVLEEATWHEHVADEQLDWAGSGYDGMLLGAAALVDVEGHPSFFYECLQSSDPDDPRAYELKFIRAEDAHGESWGEPLVLGATSSHSQARTDAFFGGAGIVEGRPAAAYVYQYLDEGGHFVKQSMIFIRADDDTGSSWPAGTEIHTSYETDGSLFPRQFHIVTGKLAMTGGYGIYGGFSYMLADDASGVSWGDPINAASSLHPQDTSVAAVAGLVAGVRFENDEDLLYNRALDDTTLAWADPVLVDQLEKVEGAADLVEVDGFPAVVYYDDGLGGLKYRRALDTQGSEWGELVVLTTQASRLHMTAIIDGRPAVLFNDRIDDDVKFVSANDPQGRLWSFPSTVTVETSITLGFGNQFLPRSSFTEIAGLPAIGRIVPFKDEEENSGRRLNYVMYY